MTLGAYLCVVERVILPSFALSCSRIAAFSTSDLISCACVFRQQEVCHRDELFINGSGGNLERSASPLLRPAKLRSHKQHAESSDIMHGQARCLPQK